MPRYGDDFIGKAVALMRDLRSTGLSQDEAARRTRKLLNEQHGTRVSLRTITRWDNGQHMPVGALRTAEKVQEDLAGLYERFQRDVFAHGVSPEKIRETPIKDLFVASGIAADKMRLLREQSTVIEEARGQETNIFMQINYDER